MRLQLKLEYWRDDKWFVGRLKGVPGVFSQGKTLAALEKNVRDAYRMLMKDEESPPEGSQTIELTVEA